MRPGFARSPRLGRLVTPADADCRAAAPWVVNVDQRPAAVLEVADVDDVVAAVRWGARTACRSACSPAATPPDHPRRHPAAAHPRPAGIEVDAVQRTATVGAGVKWGELCAALDGTGLMALCGSNPDVTVVGLPLGGGVSWFTREHGFTANSVVSFDVVDAGGELSHVTRALRPGPLLGAARRRRRLRHGRADGAGPLRRAGDVRRAADVWPVEHAPDVLRAFRDLALVAPRELTLWAHVMHFPPIPDVPEPLRGRSFVTVAATYLGSAKMAEILLWSLRDAAPVDMDLMGTVHPQRARRGGRRADRADAGAGALDAPDRLRRRGHRRAGRRGR